MTTSSTACHYHQQPSYQALEWVLCFSFPVPLCHSLTHCSYEYSCPASVILVHSVSTSHHHLLVTHMYVFHLSHLPLYFIILTVSIIYLFSYYTYLFTSWTEILALAFFLFCSNCITSVSVWPACPPTLAPVNPVWILLERGASDEQICTTSKPANLDVIFLPLLHVC